MRPGDHLQTLVMLGLEEEWSLRAADNNAARALRVPAYGCSSSPLAHGTVVAEWESVARRAGIPAAEISPMRGAFITVWCPKR